jgi:hypothetical protein
MADPLPLKIGRRSVFSQHRHPGVPKGVQTGRAVSTDILHFPARVAVTPARTLSIVLEEFERRDETADDTGPCRPRPARSSATTTAFGISSTAPGT